MAKASDRSPGPQAMRRRILALLQGYPHGLTAAEMRHVLGVEKNLSDTCLGMWRAGLLQRVKRGRYVVDVRQ